MNETNLTVGFCIKPCYSEILINDVVKSVRSSPKVTEIILRPHPGYPDSYYESINKYNSEISDSRKEISSSFLKRVDILISGESSIILEAAMMRVKSIYIDDKFSPFDLYGFIKNGVTEFAEVENIAHSIDNILFSEVQKNFINSKYYCDTINTINENKSKELIRKVLF
jgi:hypothetical protein